MTTTLTRGDHVVVSGRRGVVFSVDGPHMITEEVEYPSDTDDGETIYVYVDEEVDSGLIEAHMIGDDRTFVLDPDDCTLYTDEVCSCGQEGCGHS